MERQYERREIMRNNTPKIPYDNPLRHRKTPREMLKEPICN